MKLLIVSNRLPITIIEQENTIKFKESIGGLATAISSYLNAPSTQFNSKRSVWLGWPGKIDPTLNLGFVKERIMDRFNSRAVFLTDKEIADFYLGFCNQVIWPLFHEFTEYVELKEQFWQEYKRVNKKFCNEVLKVYQPGDIIWVHDYHLMLLPKLLRQRLPNAKIGFFSHIPFPNPKVYRLLPDNIQQELMEGLLGSNLIGFHIKEYTRNFLVCIRDVLNLTPALNQIMGRDHLTKVETFPISIDYQKFAQAYKLPEVKVEMEALKQKWAGNKTVLSIDRLDYTKGVVYRILGFQKLLVNHPEYIGKVKLMLVVTPSRQEIPAYLSTKEQIENLVSLVNERFGSETWQPIIYEYRTLSFHEISAYYNMSDVCLVTPVSDGMNLIAKEFVAAKNDQPGVLVLSNKAGAVFELKSALIIDPESTAQIATAIKEALQMSKDEQQARLKMMQNLLEKNDVKLWADNFLHTLTGREKVTKTTISAPVMS